MPVSVHLFLVAGDIIIAVIAVAGDDEHGLFNAQLFEERMHAGDQRLIGAQLLRIIKKQHAEIAGKVVHIVRPHCQRVHAAVEQHKRLRAFVSGKHIAILRAAHGDALARVRGLEALQFFRKQYVIISPLDLCPPIAIFCLIAFE